MTEWIKNQENSQFLVFFRKQYEKNVKKAGNYEKGSKMTERGQNG
jgi:light-regulated signal transduction histidine kinase (bacteriophytochrome)